MYYLSRTCPIDTWRIVTERPTDGEWIELTECHYYGQAIVERDTMNGKGGVEQGVLEL